MVIHWIIVPNYGDDINDYGIWKNIIKLSKKYNIDVRYTDDVRLMFTDYYQRVIFEGNSEELKCFENELFGGKSYERGSFTNNKTS